MKKYPLYHESVDRSSKDEVQQVISTVWYLCFLSSYKCFYTAEQQKGVKVVKPTKKPATIMQQHFLLWILKMLRISKLFTCNKSENHYLSPN